MPLIKPVLWYRIGVNPEGKVQTVSLIENRGDKELVVWTIRKRERMCWTAIIRGKIEQSIWSIQPIVWKCGLNEERHARKMYQLFKTKNPTVEQAASLLETMPHKCAIVTVPMGQ